MVVIYASFDVGHPDRPAFDHWFEEHARECRTFDGCISYDYLHNLQEPTKGFVFEAWESQEQLNVLIASPSHVNMMAEGSSAWQMKNLCAHVWRQAEGLEVVELWR